MSTETKMELLKIALKYSKPNDLDSLKSVYLDLFNFIK